MSMKVHQRFTKTLFIWLLVALFLVITSTFSHEGGSVFSYLRHCFTKAIMYILYCSVVLIFYLDFTTYLSSLVAAITTMVIMSLTGIIIGFLDFSWFLKTFDQELVKNIIYIFLLGLLIRLLLEALYVFINKLSIKKEEDE